MAFQKKNMIRIIKDWFFPCFLLFLIMAEAIFHAYMAYRGIDAESGMLQILFIGIFGVSVLLLIKDNIKGWGDLRPLPVLVILVLLIILYLTSSFSVLSPPEKYKTYLLVFGSKSIPACIIGMHLARDASNTLRKVDKIIPFFILPVGIIIGLVGFKAAMMTEYLHSGEEDVGGLNYQTLSYYMAEYYAYSAYYLFFSSARETRLFKWLRWVMLPAMFFFAINCIMGGGRGAMVYMVIVSAIILYEMYKIGRVNRSYITIIVIGVIAAFIFISAKLHVFESVGFARVANNISSDDTRAELYRLAIDSFWESPLIGHGVGSVWWEVGFYSHNMIFDILVETGIIGLIILLIVGLKLYKRMFALCKYDSSYFFLMLMFVKATLNGMFSGYYLGVYYLWLIVGLIFVRTSAYYTNIR